MNYAEFRRQVALSKNDLYGEAFADFRKSIRIKKEKTGVKNLERIFSAVLKISNQKGFQAMSMRDLGRETRLSMGALYSYFPSKEELLAMLQHRRRTITGRILQDWIARESDPVAKLRTAIVTHLYLSEAMQPWFYFSYMEAKNLSQEEQSRAVASERFTEQIFADIITEGQGDESFTLSDPQLSASVIKAMVQDWYLKRGKYAARQISVDQYAQFVLQVVEGFLLNGNDDSKDLDRDSGEAGSACCTHRMRSPIGANIIEV